MKLTKTQLKQLIKEELQNALNEGPLDPAPEAPVRKAMRASGYDVSAPGAPGVDDAIRQRNETNRLLAQILAALS